MVYMEVVRRSTIGSHAQLLTERLQVRALSMEVHPVMGFLEVLTKIFPKILILSCFE